MSGGLRVRPLLGGVIVAGLVVSLAGCESVRNAAGLTKQPPDEFAVVSKAPLIIPPDFNLKPPKPGAAPLNQTSPTISAQAALYGGDDPATAVQSIPGNFSDGEKLLLAQAGAANASDSIRQQITADNRNMQSAEDDFTDNLLFGSPDTSDKPVDAETEKARIDANKDARPAPAKQANQAEAPQIKKDSGGWLDGIF